MTAADRITKGVGVLIAIIDYGVGNLRSVEKAFHFIGCDAQVSQDTDFINGADAVVLPGVGAFADAMCRLEEAGLAGTVRNVITRGAPFLGICLGMQLLFESSEEGGRQVKGLGILPGRIKQLPLNMGLKVPHMGWNSLSFNSGNPLFRGLPPKPYVYFVHSYYLEAKNKDMVIARTDYGIGFDVAVNQGKLFATQFHPEKSSSTGLQILRNFAGMVE